MPPPQSNSVFGLHLATGRSAVENPRESSVSIFFCSELTQLTTIDLVASVRAVGLSVAVEVTIDAGFVLLTLELIRSTRYVLTDRRHLVVTLWAILFTVTDPALVDAGYPVAALVFQR